MLHFSQQGSILSRDASSALCSHLPKEEGVGLGLPIAQRIIKEHGGEIRLESRLGEGTIVYLTLPLKPRGKSQGG
ncbi:MAG: ATP-binding protein [Thermodesulfobacteriota bacterium]